MKSLINVMPLSYWLGVTVGDYFRDSQKWLFKTFCGGLVVRRNGSERAWVLFSLPPNAFRRNFRSKICVSTLRKSMELK